MRILHAYRDFLLKGGRPSEARSLINALAELGYETGIVSCQASETPDIVLPHPDVAIYHVPAGLRGRLAFRGILRQFQPEIVHLSGGPRIFSHNVWASELIRAGIPYVLSGCGNLSHSSYRYRWGGKKNSLWYVLSRGLYFSVFDRYLTKGAAAVHGASLNEAEIAQKLGARRVFALPFGTYTEWLRSSAPHRGVHDPVTFVYLGRLSIFHKGLDLIVESFGRLVAQGLGNRFRLILAGTTEQDSMETLRSRASELGIENIDFPGGIWDEEKEAFWSAADYYLHPCRYNGFALVAREALGNGVPLIATRESDMGDWVEQYKMGFTVQPSVESLTDVIRTTLSTEQADYGAMSKQAIHFAATHTWDDVARAFMLQYSALVSHRPVTLMPELV